MNNNSEGGSVRAASRKNRVFVFRDFLWEIYGRPNGQNGNSYLKPNDIVLDVAGGKGDLSWLFLNADGVSSVVVDPRNLSSTNHLIRSVTWLSEHPEEAQKRAVPNLPTHQPLATLLPEILERKRQRQSSQDHSNMEYLEPQHLKIKLNSDLVQALRKAQQEQNADPSLSAGSPSSWRSFWGQLMADDTTDNNQHDNSDNIFLPESERKIVPIAKPIQDANEAWNIFHSIRLVIGFHPDQGAWVEDEDIADLPVEKWLREATETCLDLAALLKVPVCIVPCCVFPSEFPDRQVAVETDSGEVEMVRVRNHELFIRYLQHKQPQLRKELLAFHYTGTPLKNIVLFTLPEDLQ